MRKAKEISKGKALILAREILGPSGHVHINVGELFPFEIGTFADKWVRVASGRTWSAALEVARQTRRAA